MHFELTLVLTHACNLACPYCYMGEHHATAMPEATALRAIDLAFERADDVVVSFFGGEPLLAWDLLVRCVDHARGAARRSGKGVRFQVTTNATLLTKERAEELSRRSVIVAVSLDGTREIHDGGRPTKGGGKSYDATLRGIEALREAGVAFTLIAVTTPLNAAALGETVRALAELCPDRIALNPSFGDAWDVDALGRWERGLEDAASFVLSRWRGERPVHVNAFDSKLAAAASATPDRHCSVGRWNVAVAPSGTLYPCDRLVGDDRERSFASGHISNGLALETELPRGPTDPECAPCAERSRCRSSCACASIAETGQSNVPGGVLCWYEQTTARIADAIGWALVEERNELFLGAAYGGIPDRVRAGPRRLYVLPAEK